MNDYDPTNLRAREDGQAASAQAETLRREIEDADFLWLMSESRGRRIVWRTMERAGVFDGGFVPDAMTMAFRAGQRNEGLYLLARIHALCPEAYSLMIEERKLRKPIH
jgi:hypothetical protein